MTKKKAGVSPVAPKEPAYTKEQLMVAKSLELPRDAVAAVLADDQLYTKSQAADLVNEFFERMV